MNIIKHKSYFLVWVYFILIVANLFPYRPKMTTKVPLKVSHLSTYLFFPVRKVKIIKERADVRESGDGGFMFPDEIEYTIRIGGIGRKHFKASRAFRARNKPEVITMGKNARMTRKNNVNRVTYCSRTSMARTPLEP